MNIQTISIVVPTKGCVNHCPFCVSRMHDCTYENTFDKLQIEKRIKYAVMNGVNTCIITGTGEALQNYHFLGRLADIFRDMNYPFPNVELQTTGVMLTDFDDSLVNTASGKDNHNYHNIAMLKELGVNTISLSVASIFNQKLNSEIIGINKKLDFELDKLIQFLKGNGFNIRLSLNMLKDYDDYTPEEIIKKCKQLGANQVTFRKMYRGTEGTHEGAWVSLNSCKDKTLTAIKQYIEGFEVGTPGIKTPETKWHFQKGQGAFLYKLPFGGKVYSIEGMSTVIDDDCMSKESNDSLKYCILRENGKLYCRWDDEGSLIF